MNWYGPTPMNLPMPPTSQPTQPTFSPAHYHPTQYANTNTHHTYSSPYPPSIYTPVSSVGYVTSSAYQPTPPLAQPISTWHPAPSTNTNNYSPYTSYQTTVNHSYAPTYVYGGHGYSYQTSGLPLPTPSSLPMNNSPPFHIVSPAPPHDATRTSVLLSPPSASSSIPMSSLHIRSLSGGLLSVSHVDSPIPPSNGSIRGSPSTSTYAPLTTNDTYTHNSNVSPKQSQPRMHVPMSGLSHSLSYTFPSHQSLNGLHTMGQSLTSSPIRSDKDTNRSRRMVSGDASGSSPYSHPTHHKLLSVKSGSLQHSASSSPIGFNPNSTHSNPYNQFQSPPKNVRLADEVLAPPSSSTLDGMDDSESTTSTLGDSFFRTPIECGLVNLSPSLPYRIFNAYSPFFGAVVPVYTACDDHNHPSRVLFRAGSLAKKHSCSLNKIAMYLARQRSAANGIFQATNFVLKPRGVAGLKAGGYFLSIDACERYEARMKELREKENTRLNGGLTFTNEIDGRGENDEGKRKIADGKPIDKSLLDKASPNSSSTDGVPASGTTAPNSSDPVDDSVTNASPLEGLPIDTNLDYDHDGAPVVTELVSETAFWEALGDRHLSRYHIYVLVSSSAPNDKSNASNHRIMCFPVDQFPKELLQHTNADGSIERLPTKESDELIAEYYRKKFASQANGITNDLKNDGIDDKLLASTLNDDDDHDSSVSDSSDSYIPPNGRRRVNSTSSSRSMIQPSSVPSHQLKTSQNSQQSNGRHHLHMNIDDLKNVPEGGTPPSASSSIGKRRREDGDQSAHTPPQPETNPSLTPITQQTKRQRQEDDDEVQSSTPTQHSSTPSALLSGSSVDSNYGSG